MSLYDPQEFPSDLPRETVEAPTLDFTVADFLAFCRTKGPAEYNYWDVCGCACGQFADFAGIDWTRGKPGWDARVKFEHAYDKQLREFPRTFSALADRLARLAQ